MFSQMVGCFVSKVFALKMDRIVSRILMQINIERSLS